MLRTVPQVTHVIGDDAAYGMIRGFKLDHTKVTDLGCSLDRPCILLEDHEEQMLYEGKFVPMFL